MKNVKNFKEFINEAYIHDGYDTINDVIDLRDYDFTFNNDKQSVKLMNQFLRKNKLKKIKLYHGTSSNHNILEDGILTTKTKTKRSLQSETGYVYLSIYPDASKTFGKIAYPYDDISVYEVIVPIKHLKADKDQLRNVRQWKDGENIPMFDDLGESACFGHGFRIKGDIPPYMIKKVE